MCECSICRPVHTDSPGLLTGCTPAWLATPSPHPWLQPHLFVLTVQDVEDQEEFLLE